MTPDRYRNPADLPDGRRAGRRRLGDRRPAGRRTGGDGRTGCLLAVGRHTRLPRRYRGRDIMWWLDRMGVLDRPVDRQRIRRQPSPRCRSSAAHRTGRDARDVDLPAWLHAASDSADRLAGVDGTRVDVRQRSCGDAAAADARLTGCCAGSMITSSRPGWNSPSDHRRPRARSRRTPGPRPGRPAVGRDPLRRLGDRLPAALPVAARAGARCRRRDPACRRVDRGARPGGGRQRWQTRRSSTFLDGVRHDAALVVDHLIHCALAGTARRAS